MSFFFFSDDLYHGFLFAKDDSMEAMPIYDLNGNLAGVQSAVSACLRTKAKGFKLLQ